MKELTSNTPQELIPLLPGYFQRRFTELDLLVTHLSEQKFDLIARIGHQLKGSGAGYGFEILSQLGDELETAAKEKDSPSVQKILDRYADLLTALTANI